MQQIKQTREFPILFLSVNLFSFYCKFGQFSLSQISILISILVDKSTVFSNAQKPHKYKLKHQQNTNSPSANCDLQAAPSRDARLSQRRSRALKSWQTGRDRPPKRTLLRRSACAAVCWLLGWPKFASDLSSLLRLSFGGLSEPQAANFACAKLACFYQSSSCGLLRVQTRRLWLSMWCL